MESKGVYSGCLFSGLVEHGFSDGISLVEQAKNAIEIELGKLSVAAPLEGGAVLLVGGELAGNLRHVRSGGARRPPVCKL